MTLPLTDIIGILLIALTVGCVGAFMLRADFPRR